MTSSIRRALAARSCSAVTAPSLGGDRLGQRGPVPHGGTVVPARRRVEDEEDHGQQDDAGEHPGPVNIGNPAEVTVLELVSEVLAVTGPPSPVVFEPLPLDDPARRQPDISLARRLLGWEPAVSLAEGLRRTADWLAGQLAGA